MAYADRIKALGPSAYFPCREQSGAVVDIIGSLSGTVSGCTRGGFALPGGKGLTYANSASVSTDYVTVADNAAVRSAAAFSVECWVTFNVLLSTYGTSPSATPQTCWLNKAFTSHVQPYYEYGFFSSPIAAGSSTYYYDFYFAGNSVLQYAEVQGPAWTVGVPQHFVGIYDGSNLATIYVNGVGTSRAIGAVTTGQYSTPLHFGRYSNVSTQQGAPWHNGTISDVAIYQRALTAAEVLGNYRTGLREGVSY